MKCGHEGDNDTQLKITQRDTQLKITCRLPECTTGQAIEGARDQVHPTCIVQVAPDCSRRQDKDLWSGTLTPQPINVYSRCGSTRCMQIDERNPLLPLCACKNMNLPQIDGQLGVRAFYMVYITVDAIPVACANSNCQLKTVALFAGSVFWLLSESSRNCFFSNHDEYLAFSCCHVACKGNSCFQMASNRPTEKRHAPLSQQ